MSDSLDPFQLTQQILFLFPEVSMPFLLSKILLLELLGQPVNFLIVEVNDILLLVKEHFARPHLNQGDFLENLLVSLPDVLEVDPVVIPRVQLLRSELLVQFLDDLPILLLSTNVLLEPFIFEHQ